MTEATDLSRAEIEATELDDLREKVRELERRDAQVEMVEPTLSTRDRSPVKPQDHKPAETEVINLTFYGVDVEIQRRLIKDWRMVRLIGRSQNNDMSAASEILDFLLGVEAHEQIIANIVEADGWCDAEKIETITTELFEALDAGN